MPATPQQIQDALALVTDQASFIQDLLIDTLGWDIPDTQKIEGLGYEWYLDEDFGLDDEKQRNLSDVAVVQIPISRDLDLFGEEISEKWGVFVIRFKDAYYLKKGRGLTSPLRKMLRALVRQKADLPSFASDNILFICADPSFQSVTFARFKKTVGKNVAPLATFGWREGEKNAVRTLCEHNLPNLHWHSDWRKAFDIEPVTRAFYNDIFTWFNHASPQVTFPLKDAVRALNRELEDLKSEALIRLVIRLIFIWFMKEKEGLVPADLFNQAAIQKYLRESIGGEDGKGAAYYNAVLQNLFFATLNCPQDKRRFRGEHDFNDTDRAKNDRGISILYRFKDEMSDPDGLSDIFAQVPFLNGGLFTCHDDIRKFVFGEKRESYHLDGFSENSNDRAILPDALFFAPDGRSGILDILKRYHFTIEEHTPMEQEVALDPELLGHVFENLLAAYNPETRETARKKTGSYYTPRNIVDYMVGESLKYYLARQMGWESDASQQGKLETLLDYEQEQNPFDDEDSRLLRNALYKVKIFDPACGSGAFPMGALQRLNHVLQKLNEEATSYQRKLTMISHNIYGADIQPIATEITTQRFFISLLIDQVVNKDKPNLGIEPLPNLEVKFMTANTLQSLHWKVETDLRKGTQDDMFYSAVAEQVDAIKTVFVNYLQASTAKEKDDIRGYFQNAKETLLKEFASVNIPEADRELFKAWEPFGFSKSAGFFDPQLMFGLTRPDGFDIVIGNPPYVRHETISKDKPALKREFGAFFKGTADLYTYFYAKGIALLRPGGILAYITPNKFMSTSYGDNTRILLTNDAHPKVLIDFNEFPVFEATTYPLIAIIQKGPPAADETFLALPEKNLANGDWTDPQTALNDHGFAQPVATLKDTGWLLERPEILALIDKLQDHATPLGKYVGDKFYRGVTTGFNDAFVIDEVTKDELIQKDPNSADLIKPWLRGRDINKWSADNLSRFIIFTRRGIQIDSFPAIKAYLQEYRDELEPKSSPTQKTGRKPGAYQWFEIQDNIAYFEEFDKPKIIWGDIAQHFRAVYDTSGSFVGNTAYIMPVDDNFLIGLLHSKVIDWFVNKTFPAIMGKSFRFISQNVQNLPIPNASAEQKAKIANLANQIIDLKSVITDADVTKFERQIDEIVYTLFNLTDEEITLIERGKANA